MLYISNAEEFVFWLSDILPYMLLCWAVCFAALLAVCVLIRNEKLRSVVRACILGIGIGFFVQGSFMSGGYGQLNGQDIAWETMIGKGIVNTIVWIACITIPIIVTLLLKKNKIRFQNTVACVLLAIQVLSCAVMGVTAAVNQESQEIEFTISTEDAFTLSDKKNVVVFLLDNFSSVLFEEIISEDQTYQQQFDGFTYFPDTSGIGCTTKGSLPFILTGKWNENSIPYKEYLNKGYRNTLYESLEKADYDTRLFVEKKYVGSDAIGYFDNMIAEKSQVDTKKTTELMYKFTAFTYMPHFLKEPFWFYTGEFASASQGTTSPIKLTPDPQFYTSLNEYGITIDESYEGAYRFYYTSGAHKPYNMNENAEAVESGSVTMKQRAKGALKIVSTYLEKLRELDIYDNTMVMVLADHGDWEDAVVFNPMLFVKPFNSEVDGLAVSSAQITYEDLMPTLVEAVTGKNAGTTVFEVDEEQQRERRFLYYAWDGNWESDYLPDLHEYVIQGNVRDSSSRTATGRIYTGDGLVENAVEYPIGKTVRYTTADAGMQTYVYYGLYYPEDWYTFAKGGFTEWVFPLQSYDGRDLRFDLKISGVKESYQRVRFVLNGEFMEEAEVTDKGILSFAIPADRIADPRVRIRLEFPDASASDGDERIRSIAIHSVELNYADTVPFTVPIEEQRAAEAKANEKMGITDIVSIPLAALMRLCYQIAGHYSLAVVLFTLLTKVILFPVSMWVQRNGIAMVKITPEINRLKMKYYGDKDAIADETQLLYKREKYNPLASTIPMIVQLVMLMGVIGAVKQVMGSADTVLNILPSEAGGVTLLMPLMAGAAALALGLAQNRLNPLQREQGKSEQWMTNGFSIAISLILGAFVPLGVGIYWICSNVFSIVQQALLNCVVRPEKYIDYEDLARSKKELEALNSLSSGVSREDRMREKEDYKRFFSIANKHLVFYSEKSGFYKYFKDVMDYILRRTNAVIHYVTSDPKDQIFEIAKTQPRIKPYYIGENKLITLMMKMDADIVVMTVPDLNKYHLKRSYVRKDIEYIYMFHYPLSTHMVLQTGALDHYDTIFCVGEFQFDEIRAAERVYDLPAKKLIAAGYGQLEQLDASYQAMPKVKRERPKILIAPSWQEDNILDSCIDSLLCQLLDKGYEVVVRPHPEYVKRYKPRMDQIVERYQGREASGLKFELDFTSNNSIFDSDVLITDWSGTAYEFSFVTLKPSVFIDTKPKINNPEYTKLGIEPLEFSLRSQVGIQVKPDEMDGLDKRIDELLAGGEQYEQKILGIREKYIANFGRSGEVGGRYIISQMLERGKERKSK